MRKKFFHIVGLYERACGDGLSPEEREEWERLMEVERWRCLWEELKSGALAKEGMASKGRFSAEEGFREFRRRTYGRARRRRIWLCSGIGAVAALLVVVLNVAFGWWSQLNSEREWKPYTVASLDGIYAEQHQATLVLASGKRVMVTGEDAAEGMREVTDEGGARVHVGNGGVDYTRTGEDGGEGKTGEEEVVYNELIVPMGGECFVVLEDSSRVWMNAGSRLRYPSRFTGEERGVELEGEAYFEVEHEEGRPFRVEVGGELVEVLGTAFDVKAYPGERRYTTLVSGRVKVRSDEGEEVVLAPGEQRVADENGWRVETVDVEKVTSWRMGMFVLEDQTLEEVMDQLGRWYSFTVFYRNEGLKEVVFKGKVPRYTTFEEILRVLEKTGGIHFGVEGSTVTVYN